MAKKDKKADYPSRTFRIPPELLDRLDDYCGGTGVSKTFVIERALKEYLDRNESNAKGGDGA